MKEIVNLIVMSTSAVERNRLGRGGGCYDSFLTLSLSLFCKNFTDIMK